MNLDDPVVIPWLHFSARPLLKPGCDRRALTRHRTAFSPRPGPHIPTRSGDCWSSHSGRILPDRPMPDEKIHDPDGGFMIKRRFMTGSRTMALAVLALAPIPVPAADGDLDPTFGVGGRVTYADAGANASAIQSDGK